MQWEYVGGIVSEEPEITERRFGPRRAVDVKVFAHDGIALRKCTLRDIGLQGAFIETDFLLSEGGDVELVIRLHRAGKHLHCRFPAKVARTKAGGAPARVGNTRRWPAASRSTAACGVLKQLAQQALVDLVYTDDPQRGIEASY